MPIQFNRLQGTTGTSLVETIEGISQDVSPSAGVSGVAESFGTLGANVHEVAQTVARRAAVLRQQVDAFLINIRAA